MSPQASSPAPHALLVDDQEDVRDSIALALEDVGYRVTQAADGVEAMQLLENETYDVVLCDLNMPKMGGRSLLERVRDQAPAVRVIVMTGYTAAEDVLVLLREGAVGVLMKPFEPELLLHEIARALYDGSSRAVQA